MKWRNPLRVILLVAAIVFSALNPSRAEQKNWMDSGNDFLLKCSEAYPPKPRTSEETAVDAYCVGVVHGLRFVAKITGACIPKQ